MPLPEPNPSRVLNLNLSKWFDAEVQPHEPTLRAYLHRKFPRLSDVDDVVQESYLKSFQAHLEGRLRCARGFLFVAARNLALDTFRRRLTTPFVNNVLNDKYWLERNRLADPRMWRFSLDSQF